ncbi:helix-turn-helix domain-containing protein [Saccharopolyspora sp. NPDC002578]
MSGDQRISARRFRLLCEQRGYGYPELVRDLGKRGVVVTRPGVAKLGRAPDSPVPHYAAELALVLKSSVGYLVGRDRQFLGKRFRDLYRERGCSLAALADQLHRYRQVTVSTQYLQQLACSRNTNPRAEIVDGLAVLLATTPDYLNGCEDQVPRREDAQQPGDPIVG